MESVSQGGVWLFYSQFSYLVRYWCYSGPHVRDGLQGHAIEWVRSLSLNDSILYVGSLSLTLYPVNLLFGSSRSNECGGPCPYDPKDWYNYYWLYDVDDIANAGNPWEPKPYAYGVWELPFVTDREEHIVIGATVGTDGILYVALANAGQIETYDRPPLILTFQLPTSR